MARGKRQSGATFDSLFNDAVLRFKKANFDVKSPTPSVSGFLRQAGLSRSTFYEKHQHLLPELKALLEPVEPETSPLTRELSRSALKKALIDSKRRYQHDYAQIVSTTLLELREACGPVLREKTQMALLLHDRDRQIVALQATVSSQYTIIQTLLAKLNST